MKKLLFLLAFVPMLTLAQPSKYTHNNTRYVDDFADVLTPQEEAQIEAIVKNFWGTTQIAVVTVPSLDGYEVMDFAVELGNQWGVGGRSDNGIMFLHAPNERKYATATGPGISGDLTDIQTGRLQRDLLVPELKAGNFAAGYIALLKAYISELDPAAKELRQIEEKKQAEISAKQWDSFKSGFFNVMLFLLFGGLIVAIILYIRHLTTAKQRRLDELSNQYDQIDNKASKYKQVVEEGLKANIPEASDLNTNLQFFYKERTSTRQWTEQEYKSAIESFNEFCTKVDDLLSKISTKLGILKNAKAMYNSSNQATAYTSKKNQLQTALSNLKFDKTNYSNQIARLSELINNLNSERNKLQSYIEVGEYGPIDKQTDMVKLAMNAIDTLVNKLSMAVDADNAQVHEARAYKGKLQSQIASMESICGHKQVNATKAAERALNDIDRVKARLHEFDTASLAEQKDVYAALIPMLSVSSIIAVKQIVDDYEREQKRIRDEERRRQEEIDRKRREEERRQREAREAEERARRRRREEEEEADRRRRDSYSSSYSSSSSSSWGSSSSDSSSSSSFGGGSFDGGGSSGSY